MALFKYYYDLMSQPCRAVYMFLRLNKVPYEDKPVAVRKGENLTEEYTKVNPFRLVPAMEDNGFCLTESIAMVDYIMKTRQVPEHWYPTSDPQLRARVSEYLHWQHVNTRLNCAMLFRHLLIIPRELKKPVDQEKVKEYRGKVEETFDKMENYFLSAAPSSSSSSSSPLYLGHSPVMTVADLFGACELMQLHAVMEEGLYERRPVLGAWMDRVREETQPVFKEAHKVVYMVRQAYATMDLKQ